MTAHVRKIMLPNHPAAKAAVLERNLRAGWAPVPGISDHEMGTIMRADDPTAPLWVPAHDGPPHRTIAARAHWGRLATALTLVGGLAAVAGLAVR